MGTLTILVTDGLSENVINSKMQRNLWELLQCNFTVKLCGLILLENSLSFSCAELCAIYSFLDKRFLLFLCISHTQ